MSKPRTDIDIMEEIKDIYDKIKFNEQLFKTTELSFKLHNEAQKRLKELHYELNKYLARYEDYDKKENEDKKSENN